MKNEAQQAAISAHGKKDLQDAPGFTIHRIKTVHKCILVQQNV